MTEHDLTTESGVLAYLQQGPYPTSIKASRLAGGSSGFVYRVTTKTLLENGVASFILKHVQGYAARASAFKLDQNRLVNGQSPVVMYIDKLTGLRLSNIRP